MRRFAGSLPTPGLPVLAGALGEAVDLRSPLPRSRCAGGLEEVGGGGKGQGEGEGGGEAEDAGEGEGEDCCERGEDAEAERPCPAGPAAHSGRMGGMVSLERHQAQHLLVFLWDQEEKEEEEEEKDEVASLILLDFFLRLLVSGSHLFRVGLA